QPPKNKGKGKKPAKARSPVLINGLTKEEMSKEQMEDHAAQLREELDREREERNYFQLERDKMYSFMEIARRELEEVKAELRITDKVIEENERRHQCELKVYKQKVKHVLCEHQNLMSELEAKAAASAEATQKEQEVIEAEIRAEKEAITVDLQDVESEKLALEILLQKHNEEMAQVRDRGEKQHADVLAKYEEKMVLTPQELENIRKTQISERQQYWDNQMAALKDEHSRAVTEWDVVIARIKQDADLNLSLKAQIKDLKMKQRENKTEVTQVLLENKYFDEALSKLEKKITEAEKKTKTFISEMFSGVSAHNTVEQMRTQTLEDLKSKTEALEQEVWKLEQQRDELQRTLNQKLQEVQQEGNEKILPLENEVKTLSERLETTQAQVASATSASNADPAALDDLLKDVEEQLDTANNTIRMLQMEKAERSEAREDLQMFVSRPKPAIAKEEFVRSVESLT
uniref:Dynein regulatory complex subunit 4 n=1 Tax=Tetraodon nigroviridis TaxID=99883 RepID=H3CV81_TETNG